MEAGTEREPVAVHKLALTVIPEDSDLTVLHILCESLPVIDGVGKQGAVPNFHMAIIELCRDRRL